MLATIEFRTFLSSCLLSKNIQIKIYETIILRVDLYVCETWSLTLRDEQRVKLLEDRVLRRIFGPKRDEIIEGWRKFHTEELYNLCSSGQNGIICDILVNDRAEHLVQHRNISSMLSPVQGVTHIPITNSSQHSQ
jgi:hypothetical protein